MNKMDFLNLLEIFSQWEGLVSNIHGKKITDEAIQLKLKLEQEILKQ